MSKNLNMRVRFCRKTLICALFGAKRLYFRTCSRKVWDEIGQTLASGTLVGFWLENSPGLSRRARKTNFTKRELQKPTIDGVRPTCLSPKCVKTRRPRLFDPKNAQIKVFRSRQRADRGFSTQTTRRSRFFDPENTQIDVFPLNKRADQFFRSKSRPSASLKSAFGLL